MKLNRAKQRMEADQPALGAVLGLGSPLVAGALAQQSFDFLLLDAQHGPWHLDSAWEAFRLIFEHGGVPMARVTQNDPYAIGAMLDRGALGVVVPMVETQAQARAAAAAARYGPRGKRSIGGRSMRRWLEISENELDREIFVAVQIESARGIEHAEAILSVDGIDGCWVGPSDLALSLGLNLNEENDRRTHEQAIHAVLAACQCTGKTPGIATAGPGNRWLEAGFRFVTVGSDAGCLGTGAQALLHKYAAFKH